MEEEKKSFIKNNYPEEIDIAHLIKKLWFQRRFIIISSIIFLFIGVIIAYTLPIMYKSTCAVAPQTGSNRSSAGMGSVASLMGINLGTAIMTEGTLSPNMYPEIVKSVPFTREIMNTEIIVEKSNGKTITLFDYYTDKQYQKFNLISTVKKYTIGLPYLVMSGLKNKDVVKIGEFPTNDSTSTVAIYTLSALERRAYNAIQSAIEIQPNSRNGLVTIGYSFPEPMAAAIITGKVYATLEEYIGRFRSEKVTDNLTFVDQSYQTAKKDFFEAQYKLAAFQDANRGLTTATARSTQARLQNEYDIAFTLYRELATQLEQAKISVKENQTILTLVNPTVVPNSKSAPRRGVIITGSFIIGIVISSLWILLLPFFKSIRKETNILN